MLMSILLVAGSVLAARVVSLVIMGASIAAGIALLSYVVITVRLGRVFEPGTT